MGLVYKGHSLDDYINRMYNLKLITGIQSNQGKYDRMDAGQVSEFCSFMKADGFSEFADFFHFTFRAEKFAVEVAEKVIIVENDKLVYKEGNLPKDFEDVQNFVSQAGQLAGISLAIPYVGEAIAGIVGLVSFINLFSNEASNKADETKAKMWTWRNSLSSIKTQGLNQGKKEYRIYTFAQATGSHLFHQRPQCTLGTVNCQRDFYRYKFRIEFFEASAKALCEVITTYWNIENWKKFIDDYDMIIASIVPSTIKKYVPPKTQEPIQTEEGTGIGKLVAGIAGIYLANKILGG